MREKLWEVIYEDRALLVVRKAAGLAVESRKSTVPDLERELKNERARRGEAPEIFLINRLDQPVEGLVCAAKTKEAAAALSGQLQDGRMKKSYLACVTGEIPEEGSLTDWLLRDPKTNTSRAVPEGTKGAKRAELHFRKSGEGEVSVDLVTGRHHQIRVQLAHAGMPIRGDRKYGGEPGNALMLCACRLSFVHPESGERVTFEAEPSWKRAEKAE